MNTGDVVTDSRQRRWTLGATLGRGTWGTSWLVRDDAGRQAVLKAPFTTEDLKGQAVPEGLPGAIRLIAREHCELLGRRDWPFLPVLEGEIALPDGGTAVVIPRYPDTLARRISTGASLEELVELASRVAHLLKKVGAVHGNLRPTNVLLDDTGQPFLSDPATPSQAAWARRLESIRQDSGAPWPPETEDQLQSQGTDTWALCRILFVATQTPGTSAASEPLDRHALADFKNRVVGRLGASGSNPRFRGRVADRLGSLVNRGLSDNVEPSPPYRFHRIDDLAQRIDEVAALLSPRVVDAGKLILGSEAPSGVFPGGRPVSFSVNIAASAGITDHDDLTTGLQLFDLDAPDTRIPLDDVSFDAKTHATGRLRFAFSIPGVRPGRYRIHAAFGIKDSASPLTVVEGTFEVRPPPGWVPPPHEDAGSAPIPMLPRPPSPPSGGTLGGGDLVGSNDPAISHPRPVTPPSDEPPSPTPIPIDSVPPVDLTRTPVSPPVVSPPTNTPQGGTQNPEPWFSNQRWEPAHDRDEGTGLPQIGPQDDLPDEWSNDDPKPPGLFDRLTDWYRSEPQGAAIAAVLGTLVVVLVILTLFRAC